MIIGSVIEHHEKVSSTNAVAVLKIRNEKPCEGTIVTALFQEKGRGQMGNAWESEAGKNLLMSVILYPEMIIAENQFILSKMVSVAVYDLIRNETSDVKIKWPNDIYVKDDKIAGILIENAVLGNAISSCIAGIGLNVNQKKFISGAPNPVSLSIVTGKNYECQQLLEDLAHLLDERYNMIMQGKGDRLSEDYLQALYRRGEWHRYTDDRGEFTGMIEYVKPDGMLVIRMKNGSSKEYAFKEIEYIL